MKNERKEELKDEMKNRISLALKDPILQQGFEIICKENAELKSENQKWKDEWQEQVQKATDEGYARTLQTIQLSKAKELLKKFMKFYERTARECYSKDFQKTLADTEQFISEVEK